MLLKMVQNVHGDGFQRPKYDDNRDYEGMLYHQEKKINAFEKLKISGFTFSVQNDQRVMSHKRKSYNKFSQQKKL